MSGYGATAYSSRIYWLLTLEWAGNTYRWSSAPVDVPSDDGDIPFDGGLEPVELEVSLGTIGEVGASTSIPFEVAFPESVDVAELISLGHDLSEGIAEIAIWSEGSRWEDRVVVLVGPLREPVYGGDDGLVSFSVEDGLVADRSLIPSGSSVASAANWPASTLVEAEGLTYPIVIGKPGYLRRAGSTCAAVPALPLYALPTFSGDAVIEILTTGLLVAGHDVVAGTVIVFDGSGSYYYGLLSDTDESKNIVSTAAIDSNVDQYATEFFTGWFYDGGIKKPGTNTFIHEAVDVILWALQQTSVRVDLTAWEAVRPMLSSFKVDGYIDERVSPWDWLVDNILPLLPISILPGPRGYYPVVWRLNATAEEAVAHLNADEGQVERDSAITYSKTSEVVNDFTLSYSPDLNRGGFRTTLRLHGDETVDVSEDVLLTRACIVSRTKYGTRSEELESDWVWEPATALAVLQWRAAAYALPRRSVSYAVGAEWGWLRVGDVITVTDSEVWFAETVCLLTSVRWADETTIVLGLTVLDHPERRV